MLTYYVRPLVSVGERILQDLSKRAKVRCGLASFRNLRTGELEDRMESFALSETLKVSLMPLID